MENLFKGFHETSDVTITDIWKNKSTLFIFDTNVLLNLYRYGEHTREDFFKVLNNIENIWIPYHVGLEYQRNRINVIKHEKNIFKILTDYTENLEKSLNCKTIEPLKLNERLPLVNSEFNSFKKSISKIISKYNKFINEENAKQPEVRSGDSIRKEIYKVFNGKIGDKPNGQEWLDNIYKEGEIRYKNNIPPGYKDNNKSNSDDNLFTYSNLNYNSKFGDLIIWNQIIEKAKNTEITDVIFITDDIKEDWMYIVHSNGKKVIGCRAELREEIFTKSNINNFIIFQSYEFIKKYNEISQIQVDANSIKEIEKSSHYEIIEDKYYSDLIANEKTFSDALANQKKYFDVLANQKSIFDVMANQKNYFDVLANQKNIFDVMANQTTFTDIMKKILNYNNINNKKELEE